MADKERRSTPHLSPFDAIRHVDEQLGEYWSARELYKILGYTEWRNFHNVVIKRALKACEENGRAVSEHFVQSYKMSKTGQGGKRSTEDVLLSRYAAYLVVSAPVKGINSSGVIDLVPCGNGDCSVPYLRPERGKGNIARHTEGETKAPSGRRVPQSNLDTVKARLPEAQNRAE